MFPMFLETRSNETCPYQKCSATLIEVVAQVESLETVGELHIPEKFSESLVRLPTKCVTV